MGARFPSVWSNVIQNQLPASAAETVICQLPPFNISLDFSQILLQWFANITSGATSTSLVFRIRRGLTTAGVFIGVATWGNTTTAGNTYVLSGSYADTPGAVAGQQYVLTCVQTAATGVGTVFDVSLLAFAL